MIQVQTADTKEGANANAMAENKMFTQRETSFLTLSMRQPSWNASPPAMTANDSTSRSLLPYMHCSFSSLPKDLYCACISVWLLAQELVLRFVLYPFWHLFLFHLS